MCNGPPPPPPSPPPPSLEVSACRRATARGFRPLLWLEACPLILGPYYKGNLADVRSILLWHLGTFTAATVCILDILQGQCNMVLAFFGTQFHFGLWFSRFVIFVLSKTHSDVRNFITGFIRGILRGVRYAKSLRVLFLHRRSPSWTTLVLYSRVVFIFNEPAICPHRFNKGHYIH